MDSDIRYHGSGVYIDIRPLETTTCWKPSANHLSEPPFAFYLKYYVNQASQISAAPDSVLTLEVTNSNLYKGSINYLDLTGPPLHWLLAVSSVTVQGKTITIDPPSGLAAIDTGTTLIGAPTPLPQVFWPECLTPQSLPAIGKASCDTNVTVHISFGGTNWAISPLDMNLGTLNGTMIGNVNITSQKCASSIFDIGIGSTPYSMFIGFAQLASGSSPSTRLNPVQPEVTALMLLPTSICASSGGSGNSAQALDLLLLSKTLLHHLFFLLLWRAASPSSSKQSP
ncbi:aspartic peptidase domain-containing protein [Suillus lakei]|nr:aspartic peptidase domain-containing protein [Suillus lakei]